VSKSSEAQRLFFEIKSELIRRGVPFDPADGKPMGTWVSRCPNHGDGEEVELFVVLDGDQVGIDCGPVEEGGCSSTDILAALGISEAEILPAPGDPMGVARILIQDHHDDDGELTLRHWRGGWMQWQGTHWAEAEDKAIRSWLYERLEGAQYWHVTKDGPELKPWNPNRHKIGDLLEALAAVAHTGEGIDTPSWLASARSGTQDQSNYRATEVIACSNGLLHVGTRKLLELTPLFFNRVAVPFDYDPTAPAPVKWLAFLHQLWSDDEESIAALQEFFAYVLSGRTDLHKIMLLIGPTRSGKGTIARVLAALLGKGNVAGPTLASLGTNFGLSPLLGKPLALVSDARLAGSNVHQVVERLLSISGEDLLTVDRKYRERSGKLPARFLILSNELPRFGDASGAIANRFVVLAMQQSFLGHENTSLTQELTAELTGILSWSLDGLDRLTQQGKFTEPKSSMDSILALQDLVSPVAAFVRDRCERGIGYEVAVADLFAAWREWCEDSGHKAGSVQTFGRDLRAVIPAIRISQPRTDGGRERHFQGVQLRPEPVIKTCPDWQRCSNSNCTGFRTCAEGS
jgi:putative DNA primase/helicase